SIYAGYQRALSTIVDANITTLIAAIVLFNFGTGLTKGIAVTPSIGILASMFTAIMLTRGLANFFYGGRKLRELPIWASGHGHTQATDPNRLPRPEAAGLRGLRGAAARRCGFARGARTELRHRLHGRHAGGVALRRQRA